MSEDLRKAEIHAAYYAEMGKQLSKAKEEIAKQLAIRDELKRISDGLDKLDQEIQKDIALLKKLNC